MATPVPVAVPAPAPGPAADAAPGPQLTVLVPILTSRDLDLLDLCYQSVVKQDIPGTLRVVPWIVVNSTQPGYADRVREHFAATYQFQQISVSPSNGRPGKGHNSLFQLFRELTFADWCFPVDGDDLLYPTAFMQLEALLLGPRDPPRPDMYLFLGLDQVTTVHQPGYVAVTPGVFLKTIFDEPNLLRTNEVLNPWKPEHHVGNISCPVRLALWNRRVLDAPVPIRYDEEAPFLEDYAPFLGCLENWLQGHMRLGGISNRYLYVYNVLNENNSTHQFVFQDAKDPAKFKAMNDAFKQSLDGYPTAQAQFPAVYTIPFVETAHDAPFRKTVPQKVEFLLQTLVRYYAAKAITTLQEAYRQELWPVWVTDGPKYHQRYGLLWETGTMWWYHTNLGVALFRRGAVPEARAAWETARTLARDPQQIATIEQNLQAITGPAA